MDYLSLWKYCKKELQFIVDKNFFMTIKLYQINPNRSLVNKHGAAWKKAMQSEIMGLQEKPAVSI